MTMVFVLNAKKVVLFVQMMKIVVSKQAGLVCHPAHGHMDGTLVNALINHCGKENLCNVQDDNNRLGIVHRLDADTSGLMICAKSNEAGIILSQDMKNHSTSRHYMALVCGEVAQESGKIEVPLLRTLSKHGPKMKASTDSKYYKLACIINKM